MITHETPFWVNVYRGHIDGTVRLGGVPCMNRAVACSIAETTPSGPIFRMKVRLKPNARVYLSMAV